MKRIFLSAAAILSIIHMRAQTDSGYQSRKLKPEEINLVSSYYQQNGNHAAVTGGDGTQKLMDLANVIDVKLTGYDKRLRKKTLDVELGIDHYTSASSDRVDLKANSSASYSDTRFYPSATYSLENEQKGTTLSTGLSFSNEFDYKSFGANIGFSKKTVDKNGELSARLQVYLDQVTQIQPIELRNNFSEDYGSAGRNTFAASLSYSQIINTKLQGALLVDVVQQNGFLSLPFYRVYFKDGSVHQERLPDSRFKLPVAARLNYFAGDNIIIRTYYRYYLDDWGLRAHTAMLEVPVKITPFSSISPFYRYYQQTAVKYFAGFNTHKSGDIYYTSNFDLSAFSSSFAGAGVRLSPPNGILGIQHISVLELRYGHYTKNIDMNANIVSLNLQFK
jgi:hypothetical protein